MDEWCKKIWISNLYISWCCPHQQLITWSLAPCWTFLPKVTEMRDHYLSCLSNWQTKKRTLWQMYLTVFLFSLSHFHFQVMMHTGTIHTEAHIQTQSYQSSYSRKLEKREEIGSPVLKCRSAKEKLLAAAKVERAYCLVMEKERRSRHCALSETLSNDSSVSPSTATVTQCLIMVGLCVGVYLFVGELCLASSAWQNWCVQSFGMPACVFVCVSLCGLTPDSSRSSCWSLIKNCFILPNTNTA